MEPQVHFLNVPYILTRAWDFIGDIEFDPGMIPGWVADVTHDILILGMVVSLVLLILVVYAQIRMVQVEHEGFHALEEEQAVQAHGPVGETHEHTRWDSIVALANSPSESDWRRAILEADIMLSDVLAERGFVGATVADQLRNANPIQMTTLDIAWSAHKMRNQVAHEGEKLILTERDVRATIDQYRRVFEEFQAV